MKWFIQDIRISPNGAGSSYQTSAAWAGMSGSDDSTVVKICNACSDAFVIQHVPCRILATGNIGMSIDIGASGTIDPPEEGTPWVQRFTSCLQTMLECEDRIIGVVDAPPPEHIYEAILAAEMHKDMLNAISQDARKILLLNGSEDVQYPVFSIGKTRDETFVTMPKTIAYSGSIWQEFRTDIPWGAVVLTKPGTHRMVVPLSRMIGSYRTCTPGHITIPFPDGCTCPKSTARYVQYSKNIDPSSARLSSTRGIAVKPTNSSEISITLVLEDPAGTDEEPEMKLLRNMLTSDDPAVTGAACFTLAAQSKRGTIHMNAAQDILSKHSGPGWPSAPGGPLLRHASVARSHSAWH